MKKINLVQEEFFEALQDIQDIVVNMALCDFKKEDDVENMLYEVTSELICQIMLLIDGYGRNKELKLDIIDKESGESLRTGIELHDKCVDYIKFNKNIGKFPDGNYQVKE